MSDHSFQGQAAAAAPDAGTTAGPDTANNNQPAGTEGEVPEPKTFTQEEVDRIVAKEKAKAVRRAQREQTNEAPQHAAPKDAPKPDQFKTVEEYNEALIDHKADQKLAEREALKKRSQVEESFEARTETTREKYEDFDEVVTRHPRDGGPSITDLMAEAIMEADNGPEIAYWLGTNVTESKRIAKLSPLSQAKEIGKIEAMLSETPPAKKASSAPEPIKPVGARAATPKYDTTDPRSDKMSTREWMEAEERREAAKRRAQG